jgi:hypothetical protein
MSSRPPAAGAGPSRDNYSFDRTTLIEIGRGNKALLNRLAAVATRKPTIAPGAAVKKGPIESSAQRNRRKAAEEIEKANLRLLGKLQRTKSSVSALQGKPVLRKSLGGAMTRTMSASAVSPDKPEWRDPMSTLKEVEAWRGKQESSKQPKDLRDIAMWASSDKHTLK